MIVVALECPLCKEEFKEDITPGDIRKVVCPSCFKKLRVQCICTFEVTVVEEED